MLKAKEAYKITKSALKGENFKNDLDQFIVRVDEYIFTKANDGYSELVINHTIDDSTTEKFYEFEIQEFISAKQAQLYIEKLFKRFREVMDEYEYDVTNEVSNIGYVAKKYRCEYTLTISWESSKTLAEV